MKRALSRISGNTWHYVDGRRVEGAHDRISGDVTNIAGDVDDCQLSNAERAAGVNIAELIEEVQS